MEATETTIPTPADAEQSEAERAAANLAALDERVSKNGHTQAQAREARALAKAAGVDAPKWAATSSQRSNTAGSKKASGARAGKYGAEIQAAAQRTKELLGTEKQWGPSPSRHDRVRKLVTKRLSGNVTTQGILDQAGVKSKQALRKLGKHGVSRADLAPLRPLSSDKALKNQVSGAALAAILYAWFEQVEKAEKEAAKAA